MWFDVKYFQCDDVENRRVFLWSERYDSYEEAMVGSRLADPNEYHLCIIFDAGNQYIISRSNDGEFCEEDML